MLSWLSGVACQLDQTDVGPSWLADALVLSAALLLLLWLWLQRWSAVWHHRWILVAMAFFLGGFAASTLHAQGRTRESLPADLERKSIQITGVIASLPQVGLDGIRFAFEVDEASLSALKGEVEAPSEGAPPRRLLLGWYTSWGEESVGPALLPTVRAGERWSLLVRLKRPNGLLNPHGFDRELYLFEQGIRATGSVRRGERLQSDAGYPVERWRQWVRDGIDAAVPDSRSAGVLAALAVGDQGAIEPGDWDVFRASGVSHLMSISGLHVTMFAWLAGVLLQWLWRRCIRAMHWLPAPAVGRWGGLLAALGYAVFAGWGVPAQRTVWMLAVVTLASHSGRCWHGAWVLLAAAVVVTALDPWALLQAGFWLSFAAVGLLMAGGDESERNESRDEGWRRIASRVWNTAVSGLRTQWIATWGLAPLSLLFFQQVSVVGLGANLVAIPLVTLVITPLALLGVLWSPLWSAGAWVVQQMILYLNWLASWPWAVWITPVAPAWAQAAGLAAGVLLMARVPWPLRSLAVPLLLPLAWFAPELPAAGQFELLALDVGQGTAVLVQTRHHLLLFDSGPVYTRNIDAGQRVLLPVLRALGHSKLDLMVLSHRDTDHVGGALSLLGGVPITHLLSSLELAHPVQLHAMGKRVQSQRCEAGQFWEWDGVRFDVLHPSPDDYSRSMKPNSMSCVLRIHAAGSSVLLSGDIEKAEERRLVQSYGSDLASDVLVVPHHGSKTSSTTEFLQAVQPSVAVFQAGYQNRFGHPAPSVVERYTQKGIAVKSTISCGAWHWRSVQPPHEGRCERDKRRHYWHSLESSLSGAVPLAVN